jgi:hypothetical protein
MQRRRIVTALFFVMLVAVSGCGTIGKALSPFPRPPCGAAGDGKCQSVQKTYEESLARDGGAPESDGKDSFVPPHVVEKKETCHWWQTCPASGEKVESAQAPSPIMKQGEVLRWRFGSYRTNKNVLVGPHDVWVIVKPPEFQVGTMVEP